MVGNVADRLNEAAEELLWDVDKILRGVSESEELDQALSLLMLTFHVDTMAARCFLEVGELEAARQRLREGMEELKPRTVSLVEQLVGDRPAMFFHESVQANYIDRYINIERWLRATKMYLGQSS